MPSLTLLGELRRRIKDQKHVATAMTVSVTDTVVTTALLELTMGRLILTVAGGTVRPFSIDVTDPLFDTVGKLHQQLHRYEGLAVQEDAEIDQDHPSVDLEEFGPVDVRVNGMQLRHRVFSDWELEQALTGAVRRHNPTMTTASVPPAEWELVLALAQSTICRTRAGDASKRKGTDSDVGTLLQLASAFEEQYTNDSRRLRNVIQPPKEAPTGKIGVGDVVQGQFWRRSPRNGFLVPMAVADSPPVIQLMDPDDRDAEDTNVKVRWQKSPDHNFHSYELWADTQPDVVRQKEAVVVSGLPTSMTQYENQGVVRLSTSKLKFRAFGASSNYSTVAFSTFIESYGQLITQFNVGELEPNRDYYFRLYVFNVNFDAVASSVVKIRTKPLRTKFDTLNLPTPTTGPAGTVVTVKFDTAFGAFNVDTHKLLFDGYEVTPTPVDANTFTFVVPAITQKRLPKDIAVVSPTGLTDVTYNRFTVT